MADGIDVFFESVKVATVRADQGRPTLFYDPGWRARRSAFPVSLSMPLASERHADRSIMPWLANLLPESHLTEVGQMLDVSPQDVLGILSRMGRDTAGALSIKVPRDGDGRSVPVGSEADLERLIDALPARPFLAGAEGVSMSLAGAQDKVGVTIVDGRVAIPVDGMPSTHILKPDIARLKGSVQNEAFCAVLAGMCGLDVARVTTGKAGKRSYLLVERYDRLVDGSGRVRRVHQEDFAQILGFFPVQKYEVPPLGSMYGPGPGLKSMFKAVNDHVSPGERLRLLDGVIMSVLLCNTDAHAKNYSILIGAEGRSRMAPLYDIMCGEVWPAVTKRMAQRIGGREEGVHVNAADWRRLAQDAGLSPSATLRRVAELCALVREHAPAARDAVAAMPAGGNQILDNALHHVLKRTRRIEAQLGQGPSPRHAPEPEAGPAPRP